MMMFVGDRWWLKIMLIDDGDCDNDDEYNNTDDDDNRWRWQMLI